MCGVSGTPADRGRNRPGHPGQPPSPPCRRLPARIAPGSGGGKTRPDEPNGGAVRVAGGIVYNGIQYLMEYMSSKKEVTIGITINLENYENLRLEVEGDVETHEDVDDLITFLDGILARLGRGDQATAERVDAYRRRVLAARPAVPEAPAPEKKTPEPVAEPAPREEKKACPPPEVIAAAIPPAPEHPRTPEPPAKPEEKPTVQPEAAPTEEPAPAKPSEAPAEDVCEVCGAEVTKSQAKLSQLFMSKTLCKKCMEQP